MARKLPAGMVPWKKGQSGNPAGRPVGAIDHSTRDIRKALNDLFNRNLDNVEKWLQTAAKEDPGKAIDMLLKLAEFCVPKLGRIEHVGDGGGPIAHRHASEYTNDELAAFLVATDDKGDGGGRAAETPGSPSPLN